MGDYSKAQREKLAAKGQAMPNEETGGDYPISNCQDVKDAVKLAGRSSSHSTSSVKAHIKKVAKKIGCTSSLPDDWTSGTNAEEIAEAYIQLETEEVPGIIAEGAVKDRTGVMRYKVPFYVSDSLADIPGYNERLYFPASALPGLIAEGNAQIKEARQPINVYARHKDYHDANELPIGIVSGLESEGRIGYAHLDIISEGKGGQVQSLLANKMLNAVSLRSKKGHFELSPKSINGEDVWKVERMAINGIDFAPDSPAMPTYGIETLAAENLDVKDVLPAKNSPKEGQVEFDDLTLETVRKHKPSIVEEVERPLNATIASLTAERDSWKTRAVDAEARVAESEKDAFLREVASSFKDKDATYEILAEACKDAKSKDEVSALVMPVILRGIKTGSTSVEAEKTKTKAETLFEKLFPANVAGAGQPNIDGEEDNDGIGAEAELPLPEV